MYHFNHFKVYDSVAFSTLIMLCNHHYYLGAEHSHNPKRKPRAHYAAAPHFPLSPPNPDHH